jgi:predicted dehydrogenase
MTTHDTHRARIAVVGAGWWSTQAHLPSLTHYPHAEVVAIADLSLEKLRAAGDAYGVKRQYTDFRRMLDEEALDGVVVATNHAAHYEVAKEVLARKLGLMLEKPMVLRAREARELQCMADENRVPLVIGYPWHFVPQHRQLRALITAGKIGQIQLVSNLFASMVLEFLRGRPQAYASIFSYPVTGPTSSTYSDPAIAGGGQGHLQVTHAAALLLWLTGLKPVSVAAFMEKFDLKVDVCDAITVRFDNETVGTLASTGGIAAAHSGNQKFEYRIFGTDGYATLEVLEGTCTIYANDGSVHRLDPTPPDQRYPQEATSRHLVDLLLGRATANISPADIGVRTVELLEAAYRSADEGRVIRVDEL